MKNFFTKIINFYQKNISPLKTIFLDQFGFLKGNSCVFYPSCSEYTKKAIQKYGFLKGLILASKRILRCHPWQKKHWDPLE